MNLNWKPLARDIGIVWAAMNLGGLVVGFVGGVLLGPGAIMDPRVQPSISFSSFVCGIVGFTIAGALVKTSRFKHLFIVAVGVWLISATALLVAPLTLQQWLWALPFNTVVALIGGCISFFFVRAPKVERAGV
jgi:hypothetical protein